MFKAEQVQRLQRIIKDLYGLSLGESHMNDLCNSLKRRIQELRLNSLSEYLLAIENSGKDELDHLVAMITVGETSFFRTPHQFWALRDFVFPELIRRKKERGETRLRFLSAGCATGEEPYSLAMVVMEAIKPHALMDAQIIACDVNRSFLEEARAGIYPPKDLQTVDDIIKDRYFEDMGEHFRIKQSVRDLVRFEYFNLAKDDLGKLTSEGLFDVIFCRNVLIYFDQQVFLKIVGDFYHALENHGYLFLGYSESLYGLGSKFDCVYVPSTFYYQKIGERRRRQSDREFQPRKIESAKIEPRLELFQAAPKPKAPPLHRPHIAQKPAAGKKAEGFEPSKLWHKAWEEFEKEEYDKARANFEKVIEQEPQSPHGYLGMAFICANQGEDGDAEKHLRLCFQKDRLVPEGYYLLGLLAERKEEWENAAENYQRAIFLKSDFIIAHFNLASLYFRLAELHSAKRELRAVKEILKTGSDRVYLLGGWTPKGLLDWADSHLQKIEELRK